MKMTLVVTGIENGIAREIARRIVKVTKKGRWLFAERKTFDPKTLEATVASRVVPTDLMNFRLEV